MVAEHMKLHFCLENPKLLTQGRWVQTDRVTTAFLMYKLIVGIYFLTSFALFIYLHAMILNDFWGTWMFLTHWCHKLMSTSYVLNTIMVVIRYLQENRKGEDPQGGYFDRNNAITKISWALSSTANAAAVTITTVYWTALYDPKEDKIPLATYVNLDVHIIQTIITLIDIMASARPSRFCHVYLSLAFALTYIAFNVTYVVGLDLKNPKGEEFIYPILNWKNDSGTAIVVSLSVVVLLMASHGFLCLLTFARDKIWKQWSQKFINTT